MRCDKGKGAKENSLLEINEFIQSNGTKPKVRPIRRITPKKQYELQLKGKSEENAGKRKLSSLLEESETYSDSSDASSKEDVYNTPGKVKRQKKFHNQGSRNVPKDLQEIISMLGIDEILQEKAQKTKLTADHVKNIIEQVRTNPDGATVMKNCVPGNEEQHPSIYGPKYTRAKIKKLIEQHAEETGDNILTHILCNNQGATRVNGETHTLASEEFPEEDSGDDYDPAIDHQGDKSEDEVHFGTPTGTPRTPNQSISATTPSSGGFSSQPRRRTTPRLLPLPPMHQHLGSFVQRTLDFTNPSEMTPELISSRTRSRYPMTDTPIEYLEMLFKPPDITTDMYGTVPECDKSYSDFLLEYSMPTENIDGLDDDDTADPDFNIMLDDCHITKKDLIEEIRDDKAVHVSKRECSEIITEFLDSYQHDLYDLNDYASSTTSELISKVYPTDRGELVASSNTHFSCETPRCGSVDSSMHHNNCETPLLYNSRLSSITEEDHDFVIEPPQPQNITDMPSTAPIVVKFLIPRITDQQLKVLKVQMMQHIQILTTTTLLCHRCDCWKYLATSCRKMLNEICTEANTSENIADSVFNPWNLRASIDTLKVYDSNQQLDDEYPLEDMNRKIGFTKLMKFVFFNSSAFPFIDLLPKKKYSNPTYNINSARYKKRLEMFVPPEDWLITQALREIISTEDRDKIVARGTSLQGSELRKAALTISNRRILKQKSNAIFCRIRTIRAKNKYQGKYADNPIIKFLKHGIYEQQIPTKIPRYTPCPLKNVPEFANLPPIWVLLKGEYWAQNHKERPELAVVPGDQGVVDNRPLYMIVYPNTNTTVQTPTDTGPSQSQVVQLVNIPPTTVSSQFETGFVSDPSPLLPLCSVAPACPEPVSVQGPIIVDCPTIVLEMCNTADGNNGPFLPNQNIAVETISPHQTDEALDLNMPSFYPPSEPTQIYDIVPDSSTTIHIPAVTAPDSVESSHNNSAVGPSDASGSNLSLGGIVEGICDMPFLMATPAKTPLPLMPVQSIETPIVQCNDTNLDTPWKNCDGASSTLVNAEPTGVVTRSSTFSQSKNVSASALQESKENLSPKPTATTELTRSPTKMIRRSSQRRKPPHCETSNSSNDEENIDDPDSFDEVRDTEIVKHNLEVDEDSMINLSLCPATPETSEMGDSQASNTPSSQTRTTVDSNSLARPQRSDFWELCKRSLLPNYMNVFRELKCTLAQFHSCRVAPEKLFLKVEQILINFPMLVNKFLLFLKPSQAVKISKYTDYCAATRLNYFFQKLKSHHSDKAQEIQTLTTHIRIMQKKTMSQEKIEELKSKVAPVLQCPNLLDMFGRCFHSPPPLGKFGDIAREYARTINNGRNDEFGGNNSPCCVQADSIGKPVAKEKTNKDKENDVGRVITRKKNYSKNSKINNKNS